MKPKSFTLIELLIVVFITAIIAGSAVIQVSKSSQNAQKELVEHRAGIVYKALVQFRKDMGTYPFISGKGTDSDDALDYDNTENPVPDYYYQYLQDINEDGGESQVNLEEAWLRDPENFNQLFERPIRKGLEPDKWLWNLDVRRGWNGPYLNNGKLSVDNGSDIDSLSSQFDGTPRDPVASRHKIATLDQVNQTGSEKDYFRLEYNSTIERYQLAYNLDGTETRRTLP